MKKTFSFVLALALLCGSMAVAAEGPSRAVAVISPTKGNTAHGVVWFTRDGDKVRVVADIDGLKPGVHGFHIHEFGDHTSADGMSAGGHLNPMKMPHAGPDVAQRHEGDLGNITADANGHAHLDLTDSGLSLHGAHSIIGHSVVVHAAPDDLKTQPTGNAGARVGYGVIGIAAPAKP